MFGDLFNGLIKQILVPTLNPAKKWLLSLAGLGHDGRFEYQLVTLQNIWRRNGALIQWHKIEINSRNLFTVLSLFGKRE